MSGLRNLCKLYGALVISGQRYVWDYANDEAVPEDDMPMGSERHAKSERAKYAQILKCGTSAGLEPPRS